jgi:hypothetical protein
VVIAGTSGVPLPKQQTRQRKMGRNTYFHSKCVDLAALSIKMAFGINVFLNREV